MAINISEKYPGRANPPSVDYPQGSVKNQTAPGARDGTPLDEAWANDKEGFFQSLLNESGISANGLVDKVGSSQYFDALNSLIQKQESGFASITEPGLTNWTVPDVLRSGKKTARVRVRGGGGGGGSNTAATGYKSAGGSQGGLVVHEAIDLTGVVSVPITVGASGLAGALGVNSADGGASSFGVYLTAAGGAGALGNNNLPGWGGGGSGLPGCIISRGASGTPAVRRAAADPAAQDVPGIGGGGVRGSTDPQPGADGDLDGAGGSGAAFGYKGGNGAPGRVDISW